MFVFPSPNSHANEAIFPSLLDASNLYLVVTSPLGGVNVYFAVIAPAATDCFVGTDAIVDGLFVDLVEVVFSSQLTQNKVAMIAKWKRKPNLIKLPRCRIELVEKKFSNKRNTMEDVVVKQMTDKFIIRCRRPDTGCRKVEEWILLRHCLNFLWK